MARFRARAPRAGTVDVKRLICDITTINNTPYFLVIKSIGFFGLFFKDTLILAGKG